VGLSLTAYGLCFLSQTVDVFAIVALSGILSRLLSTGSVLVATSNRAPQDLNQVGIVILELHGWMANSCLLIPVQ